MKGGTRVGAGRKPGSKNKTDSPRKGKELRKTFSFCLPPSVVRRADVLADGTMSRSDVVVEALEKHLDEVEKARNGG